LLALAPSKADGSTPEGEWDRLVGSAYDRTIYGFQIATTPEQDDAFIQQFNSRKNQGHFNLLFHNCADFARAVLNFYHPHAVRRNFIADVGITTPKQVAKSLVSYGRKHRALVDSPFVIPQVPGSLPRSRHIDGVLEAMLRTKKYALPLAILHPLITGSFAVAYLSEGRFDPRRNAAHFDLARIIQPPPPRTASSIVARANSARGVSSAIASEKGNQSVALSTPADPR
jgi:hypothetical protein